MRCDESRVRIAPSCGSGKFILTLVWATRLTSCFVYRCQAAVDGKNEQIRHFRERLNAIVATVHEQSLRMSVEGGVGALGAALAV